MLRLGCSERVHPEREDHGKVAAKVASPQQPRQEVLDLGRVEEAMAPGWLQGSARWTQHPTTTAIASTAIDR